MARYVFDVETNGFLEDLDRLHCLVLTNPDLDMMWSFAPEGKMGQAGGFEAGLAMLMEADQIIGHNIIKFDIPAIQKVYPWFKIDPAKVFDTLVGTRLIWPNLKVKDKGNKNLPGKLTGSHSLKAWGIRLGEHKGDYEGGFDKWSQKMQDYCEQDVRVNVKLFERIENKRYSPQAIELEHQFAHVLALQERQGFCFNARRAERLYAQLSADREVVRQELVETFGKWDVREKDFIPKRNNGPKGYTAGVPVPRYKTITFNPGSRQQIANRLTHLYGWKPKQFTPGGQPKIDETILGDLDYPEAQLLTRYFLIDKRISQLAEGDQAWLKKVTRQGRIHGAVNTNGAITGRCTHSHPNIGQVPKVKVTEEGIIKGEKGLYGWECRELFTSQAGWVLVGADASGLELRCLGHFMARYDAGEFIRELLEGDIHTANQKAAGLPERNMAKTFIYAFLYGAGPEKIGSIVKGGRKEGLRLQGNFLDKVPALKRLQMAVKTKAKATQELTGLDGRVLHVRSQHAALNTLLQSAGALLVKQATVFLYRDLSNQGYEFGKDWALVAHVHDEVQLECKPELSDIVGQAAVNSFIKAGEHFNFRCPLDGEYKSGPTWAHTH